VASQLCGKLPIYNISDYGFAEVYAMVPHISQIVLESSTYATQCYGQQKGACDTFISPTLPYRVDKNASCPFKDSICKSANNNLLLDTGAIDSVEHLGLNDGPHFTLRQRTHCAPLKTEGFTETVFNATASRDQVRYYYGSPLASNKNYTFMMELPLQEPVKDVIASTKGDYIVR
jgi:hypothetical protein